MFTIARLAALVLAALAVACGSAAGPAATTGDTSASGAATVTYSGFAVAPKSVEVKAGQAVTWTNKDGTTHTITAGKPGAKTGTFEKQVAGNTSASVTFATAGTFDFFCEFHSSMTGQVVVK